MGRQVRKILECLAFQFFLEKNYLQEGTFPGLLFVQLFTKRKHFKASCLFNTLQGGSIFRPAVLASSHQSQRALRVCVWHVTAQTSGHSCLAVYIPCTKEQHQQDHEAVWTGLCFPVASCCHQHEKVNTRQQAQDRTQENFKPSNARLINFMTHSWFHIHSYLTHKYDPRTTFAPAARTPAVCVQHFKPLELHTLYHLAVWDYLTNAYYSCNTMHNIILIHSASHAYIMDWLMGKGGGVQGGKWIKCTCYY